MKNDYRMYQARAGNPFLKVIVTIFALAAVSFGVAFAWQNAEDALAVAAEPAVESRNPVSAIRPEPVGQDKPSAPDSEYRDIEMDEEEPEDTPADDEISETSGGEDEAASEDSDVADTSEYTRAIVVGSVPKSKSVEYSYFSDALFFGDSISVGIPLYMQTLVPDAAVIAAQGVTPGTALTSQCIASDGGARVTMLEAAKSKGERKKIYIMLGANALDYDETPFIKGYTEFLRAVKSEYPDTVIYVQSILPVTAGVNAVYPSKNINNTRIAEYNAAIRTMALNEGVHYVDVAQALVDADGKLPSEASPFDGMHLTPEYYIKWFDYLRQHTVADQAAGPKK